MYTNIHSMAQYAALSPDDRRLHDLAVDYYGSDIRDYTIADKIRIGRSVEEGT